mgnify:CR=1 FL=1
MVRDRFQPFIEKAVSSHLILRELSLIQAATSSGKVNEGDDDGDDATLSITGSIHSGEIKALYVRDEGESKVEIVLKLPPSYPLTLPVVEFTRKIGIEEGTNGYADRNRMVAPLTPNQTGYIAGSANPNAAPSNTATQPTVNQSDNNVPSWAK